MDSTWAGVLHSAVLRGFFGQTGIFQHSDCVSSESVHRSFSVGRGVPFALGVNLTCHRCFSMWSVSASVRSWPDHYIRSRVSF